MNRVFIIGNGFDLAHGLPTSYNHFINDFWCNLKSTYKNEMIKKFISIDDLNDRFIDYSMNALNFNDFIQNIRDYTKEYNCKFEEKTFSLINNSGKYIFKFKNDFFFLINKYQSIDNWVDIENLYYSELKKIVKSNSLDVRVTDEEQEREKLEKVKKLNLEFNNIKDLLVTYLREKVSNLYDFNLEQNRGFIEFYELLKPISIYNNENQLLSEFKNIEDKNAINDLFSKQKGSGENYSKSYFLNFNYTSLISGYCRILKESSLKSEENQIHGNIYENVVFGFGDESDTDYHLIETINDNEYLSFFKSFEYVENDRYDNFLNFIDSEPFQLIIMGHSLGLSDRVLLKTIFENENCKSIKAYYHQGNYDDNFRDIIQNMSRHFSDKSLMRKKVVNKLLCKPLPQIQIPLKS